MNALTLETRLADAYTSLRAIEQADTFLGALFELEDLRSQLDDLRDRVLILACDESSTTDVAAILGVTSQAVSQQKATARARIDNRRRRGS